MWSDTGATIAAAGDDDEEKLHRHNPVRHGLSHADTGGYCGESMNAALLRPSPLAASLGAVRAGSMGISNGDLCAIDRVEHAAAM